jgi:hypothetical protein
MGDGWVMDEGWAWPLCRPCKRHRWCGHCCFAAAVPKTHRVTPVHTHTALPAVVACHVERALPWPSTVGFVCCFGSLLCTCLGYPPPSLADYRSASPLPPQAPGSRRRGLELRAYRGSCNHPISPRCPPWLPRGGTGPGPSHGDSKGAPCMQAPRYTPRVGAMVRELVHSCHSAAGGNRTGVTITIVEHEPVICSRLESVLASSAPSKCLLWSRS